jgi:mono/diheme cytochrome c family protein
MVGVIHETGRLLKAVLFGRTPSLAGGALRLSGAVAAIALAGALGGPGEAQSNVTGPRGPWLEQGWSDPVRAAYHHRSQGTLTIPIPRSWFLAVQRPEAAADAGLFSDPAYLDGFGFIPSPRGADNPDGLPVGFARTTGNDPRTGRPMDGLGFTCAACHTGRFDVGTTSVYIDGGPARIDLQAFGSKLGLALGMTQLFRYGPRFERFARRVEAIEGRPVDRGALFRRLDAFVDRGLGQYLQTIGQHNIAEGVGRLDALNRIGNTVFGEGMNIDANNALITAPVNFPHIWSTSWFMWVQYNGSIQRPMVRNAGEAMGVDAVVNYNLPPTPTPRPSATFTSTIPVGSLHDDIEEVLGGARPASQADGFTGLRAPAWPGDILPPIRPELLARGAEIYRDRCQGCHLPPTRSPEFWTSPLWSEPNGAGQRYLTLNQYAISRIGTDPAQAADMESRTVLVPVALGLHNGTGTGPRRQHDFGVALGELVQLVIDRWYDANNISPADRDRLNGYRPNGIRHPLEYKARPLDGIWATAPYLHNGSVPTLWDLLSPYAERNAHCARTGRDRCILLFGNRQFDPDRVGYRPGGGFRLDTRIRGNFNTGHLFETPVNPAQRNPGTIGPTIPADDRRALIEFLKTL